MEQRMLKTFITLVRGSAGAVIDEVQDRNALLILDQQVRDATASLEKAKRALALAVAQDRQEELCLAELERQLANLETRTLAALGGGREDLARGGADAIASLEADRDAAKNARSLFAAEIAKLRDHVRRAESRIVAVDRGRRLARAAESVRHIQRGRTEPAMAHQSTLAEAEETLSRLRERQQAAAIADAALDEIDTAAAPASTAERLAAEGFGPPLRATADDVIARLKARKSTKTAD
jgi:phage shock protein A